jgi:demethylmenaquinone methyltransferase/2-methoxy-6-polyprenyl-1,4-benzoquinol methylase
MPQTAKDGESVRTMFGRIAARYDLLNHLLSLGLDRGWWRSMAAALGARPGLRVLDVAAGTGDSSIAIARCGATVVTSDFTVPMLALGPKKTVRAGVAGLVVGSVGADAQRLPFRDSSFDALAICYGLRNVERRGEAYGEYLRVLRPGGGFVVLDFGRPERAWLRWLYGAYSRSLLPALGRLVSGDALAYSYLPESIRGFPAQRDLARELEEAGFTSVAWKDLCGGIVAIYTGNRE